MHIRPAHDADAGAIRAVQQAAFPGPEEADLVERLVAAEDAMISLVAEVEGRVVGHVMFSKMVEPKDTLGLGPVGVDPAAQGQGVGEGLIREGLARAAGLGWLGVFVLGDPAYYGRFGLSAAAAEPFSSPYAGPHFMAMALRPDGLAGKSGPATYALAFSVFET